MRDEIIRLLKSNNETIIEIKNELQSKNRLSISDILKAADLIKRLKQINSTYRSILNQ